MKIEIKNKITRFEKMFIGSLFVYPSDSYWENDIYMTTEEYEMKGKKINAIRLFDGSLCEFNEDDDVRPIENAKLLIG